MYANPLLHDASNTWTRKVISLGINKMGINNNKKIFSVVFKIFENELYVNKHLLYKQTFKGCLHFGGHPVYITPNCG